ncbi:MULTISPECIES: hypothetical protein [Streptomyces]|uniref:Tyr recombinase domain-containing protein n=2 Tax=Streptomyces TaxID=1883 RepID=A0ABU4K9E1_9ACTN|nr:hypothetical protein [Streptomyces roseolus]MDX2294366.1 hypothetical protein [Streptomyces roseolus]
MTVLNGHYALGAVNLQALALRDIDLPNRRFTVKGQSRPLDDLTCQAIRRYLDYRNRRWSSTGNPHLLITSRLPITTARSAGGGSDWPCVARKPASIFWQDRILDEVEATGARAPLYIAAVFGLRPDTAQRCVDAVYGRHDPIANF